MIALLEFFVDTKLGRGLLIVGVTALVSVVLWAGFSTHYYNKGYQAAISAVATKNQEAADAVRRTQKKVQDCFDSGGDWSAADGVCNSP